MNQLEKFFCILGGAKLSILKECPTEKNNFIAVGIGVLNTSLLSMFTMGYAISAVINGSIDNWGLLIGFSVFWGLIIFGIDWGLISTMRKKENYDFKNGSSLVLTTLFRIAVAVVISFTVSRPLEVIVFKDFLPLARREAQLNFQKDLNFDENQKVSNAEGDVTASEQNLETWNQQGRTDLGDNDQTLIALEKDKTLYDSRYKDFNTQKKNDDIISNNSIRDAQNSSNSIQSQINSKLSVYKTNSNNISSNNITISNYRNSNLELQNDIKNIENNRDKNTLQREITSNNNKIRALENSNNIISQNNKSISSEIERLRAEQAPFSRTIKNEKRNKQNRENRLSQIDKQLSNTQDKVKTQNALLDKKAKAIADSLNIVKIKYETINDTISKKAEIVFDKNKKATSVFDKDNLINNLIAVGYLERWDKDEKADLGKKEISKKVKFIRWLLIILILIVDIAPIVIKLFIKRGMYDIITENNERKSQFEKESKSKVHEMEYPKLVALQEQANLSKFEIEEIILSYSQFLKYHTILQDRTSESNENIFSKMEKAKDDAERNIYGEAKTKINAIFRKTVDKVNDVFNSYIKLLKNE